MHVSLQTITGWTWLTFVEGSELESSDLLDELVVGCRLAMLSVCFGGVELMTRQRQGKTR
jgi:hypothetical protein